MRVYKLSKLIFLVWLAMFGASAHAAIYGSSPCPYTAYSSPPSWGGTTLPLDGCTQAVLTQAMLPGLSFQDKTMFTDGTLFQSSSASFMGTIAGTGSGVLTVNAPVTGLILPNQFVYFPTVTPDTLFNNYEVARRSREGRGRNVYAHQLLWKQFSPSNSHGDDGRSDCRAEPPRPRLHVTVRQLECRGR